MGSSKIAVLGTGANGASIGADLTRAGLDVTFIDQWPAHVEAMRKDGIRIEMPDETRDDRFAHFISAKSRRFANPLMS